MRHRGMKGQLNLFDFFREPERAEDGSVKPVEMISLMSPFEPEPEEPPVEVIVEEPVLTMDLPVEVVVEETVPAEEFPPPEEATAKKSCSAVMQQCFENGGKQAFFAYLNYNKVYEKLPDAEPCIYRFEDSKEAVACYIGQIRKYAELPGWRNTRDVPVLEDARIIDVKAQDHQKNT